MTPRYVSVSDQLYRDGGFYDDPAILDEFRTSRSSFITDMGELWPSYKTNRHINCGLLSGGPDFIDRLIAQYERVNEVFTGGAACHVARLRDVYILDSAIYRIVDGETVRIYETARAIDRPYQIAPGHGPDELRSRAVQIDCAAIPIYLGSAGSAFYRHWLLDDLPRAAAVQTVSTSAERHGVEYLIPGFSGRLNRHKLDSLHALGFATSDDIIRFLPHDVVLHLDRLYYATPVSHHPTLKSPDAVRLLRDRGRDYPFLARAGADRLFIHDSSAPGPGIGNLPAVLRLFGARGFAILDVDGRSFGQQLAAVRRARVVAGPIGDALANMVFCEPGATVLQLGSEGDAETFYWDLAHAAGHEFGAVYGTPVTEHQGGTTINLGQLAAVLTKILPE